MSRTDGAKSLQSLKAPLSDTIFKHWHIDVVCQNTIPNWRSCFGIHKELPKHLNLQKLFFSFFVYIFYPYHNVNDYDNDWFNLIVSFIWKSHWIMSAKSQERFSLSVPSTFILFFFSYFRLFLRYYVVSHQDFFFFFFFFFSSFWILAMTQHSFLGIVFFADFFFLSYLCFNFSFL